VSNTPKDISMEALAATGLDIEKIQAVVEDLKEKRHRDDRVCICGHTVAKHKSSGGFVSCIPSKLVCLCKSVVPVLRSDNIRPFMMKTYGHKEEHALMLGMVKAIELGATIEWIVPMQCSRCKAETRVFPVCVTSTGFKTPESVGYDRLICEQCFKEI